MCLSHVPSKSYHSLGKYFLQECKWSEWKHTNHHSTPALYWLVYPSVSLPAADMWETLLRIFFCLWQFMSWKLWERSSISCLIILHGLVFHGGFLLAFWTHVSEYPRDFLSLMIVCFGSCDFHVSSCVSRHFGHFVSLHFSTTLRAL